MSETPHLFAGYGIELEYMIVRQDTLDILPITDQVLLQAGGEPLDDVERGNYGWSNELVQHVIEIKNIEPVRTTAGWRGLSGRGSGRQQGPGQPENACLLPGAMHPGWTRAGNRSLAHGDNQIYRAYDRIFDCRGTAGPICSPPT